MNLFDGLKRYEQEASYSEWALSIELLAKEILPLLAQYDSSPSTYALEKVHMLLVEIEKWKAGCLQDRTGNAVQNSNIHIWNALLEASKTTTDSQALLSIMRLKGFGSSRDSDSGQQRAKVATSVLRFLWPENWGVVDWRNAAMLGFLEKNGWDVEQSVIEAKLHPAREFRSIFDIIDEKGAAAYNEKYRELSQVHYNVLPRAADVDMSIFGLSLLAWSMPK